MKYIINIEPKISKNKEESYSYCHIISTKDSIITRIITSKGTEIKDINDSVKKGDIIISGDITYNNELKNKVCASGKVYGRTWYTINLSLPRYYEEITKLNKTRYNLLYKYHNKSSKVFKSRLDKYLVENNKIINLLGFELYIQKEIAINTILKEYSTKELEDNIKKEIDNKLKHTLKGEYYIIDQKVLKKDINNSKINIELFIVAEEEIGKQVINKDE